MTVTDSELALHAAHAYLEGDLRTAGSLDDADGRELARVDDTQSGVQAIALERRRDHAIVVAYAGTSSGEPVDLLADLGIGAAELRYLVIDVACHLAPPRRGARSKRGDACPHAHAEAERARAAGVPPTKALEAQLAVSRAFLDRVLTMTDLAGRPITIASITVTGHSLGGFLAQIIAAERGARGVTFNAPGAQHHAPSLHGAIVRNLARRHDVVGTFGVHLGTTELVDDVSRKPARGDHTPFVVRNHSIAAFHAWLVAAGR